MNKHLTANELKQFAAGNYPVKNLVTFSQHLAQCEKCKNGLEIIAPDFFADFGKNTAVKNERHFSNDEISAFLKAELPIKYRLEMSNHLRNCETCKAKLYQTNPQHLRQTIATYLNKEEQFEKKSLFANLNALLPIGAMAILLIGAIAYLAFISFKTDETSFQAKTVEPPIATKPSISPTSIANSNPPTKTAETNNNLPNKPEVNVNKAENIGKNKPTQNKVDAPKVIISNSRSSNSQGDCENAGQVAIVTPYFEKITESSPTFRWKPFPNAIKYNLYVSDTSQILIEEAELSKETSYKLKATLESNKEYKWKVIATMPDGKTVSSPAIEFSLGKTPQKYQFRKNKNGMINDVRCLNKEKK